MFLKLLNPVPGVELEEKETELIEPTRQSLNLNALEHSGQTSRVL